MTAKVKSRNNVVLRISGQLRELAQLNVTDIVLYIRLSSNLCFH